MLLTAFANLLSFQRATNRRAWLSQIYGNSFFNAHRGRRRATVDILEQAYDYCLPDVNDKTTTDSRCSVGVMFFPIFGVELSPMYEFKKEKPDELQNDELDVMIHFYI